MRMFDKLGWIAALLGAAFLADGSQTRKGGGPVPRDTATEIVVPAHDAQPLETVPPPPEDLNIGAPVDEPGADADPPSAPVSEVVSCHRINVGVNGGTAVCVAPGVFVTVRHVFENAGQMSVSIDRVPVSARWHLSSGEDVAVVLANVEAFEPCEWSADAPEYMAAATVVGMVSGTHTGVVSDYDTVSLSADSEGVTQGDSGGGVFVGGKLIGVLRGYRGGVGENRRVVKFTPLHQVPDLVAVLSPASSQSASGLPVVTVYTTSGDWCGACNLVKEWADDDDLPFRVEFIYDDPAHTTIPYIEWHVGNMRWWFGQSFTPSKANVVSSWQQTQ